MRQTSSFAALLTKLLSPSFTAAHSVRIINADWPASNWRDWVTEEAVREVVPCEELEVRPSCSTICRGEKHVGVAGGGWRPVEVVLR